MTPSGNIPAPPSLPKVAIVVLNWNGREDTLRCLGSLAQLDYHPLDITVIDNGSADGLVGFLRIHRPDVTVIENGANLGFCEANNIGIRRAMAAGAEYVMLLNNDATLASDCLTRLVLAGDASPRIGILGPKTYAMGRGNTLYATGLVWRSWQGYSELIGLGEADLGQYDESCDREALGGHAFLIKRRVLEAVGELDPDYFAYYEELDYCVRARAAGFRCRYVADALAWHKGHGSPAGLLRNYLLHRNQLMFMRKNATPVQLASFVPYFILYRVPKVALSYLLRGRVDQLVILLKAVLWHVGLFRKANPVATQRRWAGAAS